MRRVADQLDETEQLLALLASLHEAVATRDLPRVQVLLDATGATRLPREVREEALAVAALPATSFRVPMALLRFHHRLTQLADAGEPEQEPAQIEIPFARERQRRTAAHATRGGHRPPRDRV